MHKLSWRFGALLCVMLFAAALPAQAFGAPVKLDDTTIFVQFWPEGETQTNVVIVGTELDPKVPLPATVQLPLPDGATPFWAGEIMGDSASTDVQREFKIVDGAKGKVVEFTVETTRAVQFDATVGAVEIKGNDIVTELRWTQAIAAKTVSFAVRVPSGVEDVRIDPEAPQKPQTNAVGEQLYTLADQILQPGDTTSVKVTYQRAGTGDTGSGVSPIVIVLGLLGAAVVALLVALALQNRRKTSAGE